MLGLPSQYLLKELLIKLVATKQKDEFSCGVAAQSNLAKGVLSFTSSFMLSVTLWGNSGCSLSRALTEVVKSSVLVSQDQVGWTEIRAGICASHFVLKKAFRSSGRGTVRYHFTSPELKQLFAFGSSLFFKCCLISVLWLIWESRFVQFSWKSNELGVVIWTQVFKLRI